MHTKPDLLPAPPLNTVEHWLAVADSKRRAGAPSEAMSALMQALALDKLHVAASLSLAELLWSMGFDAQSDRILSVLIAGNAAGEAHLLRSEQLGMYGQWAEALAALGQSPALEHPLFARWSMHRATCLLQLCRATEAETVLQCIGPVSPERQPLLDWLWVQLGLLQGGLALARERAARIDVLAGLPDPAPEYRIAFCFEVAQFWDWADEPGLAFDHWMKGHRLAAKREPIDRAQIAAFIDQSMESFSSDNLRGLSCAANTDGAPVFVVGMTRSGTTLTEQILAAHPAVHGAGERMQLGLLFSAVGGAAETASAAQRVAALRRPALDGMADRYLHDLHVLAPDARFVVDKMPGNIRHLGLVAKMLPKARIVHCTRDPRDVGLSNLSMRFRGFHPHTHDPADLGWYMGQQQKLMRHWKRTLPNPILTVDLQDWVQDFNGTLQRVLSFMGLPHHPGCERFHEAAQSLTASRQQVRQKINAKGLGRWRRYEAQLQPMIAELERAGCDMPSARSSRADA